MSMHAAKACFALGVCMILVSGASAQEPKANDAKPYAGAACTRPIADFFAKEVWAKVGSALCLQCHKQGGDAEDSQFVLRDPKKFSGHAVDEAIDHNRKLFAKMAETKAKGDYRLLLKATGGLDHGGEAVLKTDSKGYAILAEFVRRANTPATKTATPKVDDKNQPPFFQGVAMLEPNALLRRVTLSLAGRLPTDAEREAIAKQGASAMPGLLDAIMKEDAFYTRLREGFNDIFLTLGIDGNADQTVLSYEHFEKTRHWTDKHDLSHIPEKDRQKARYKLTDDYRDALLGEPMKLIEHIVRNDHPFTEIVTADYIMVTPYTARGYGIYEKLKEKFKNPDDPFEFIPVKIKALKGRSKSTDQDSATGDYPHAGILSTFQYMRRYPTTETNRNRLRARMFYLHFLGIDALELAARVSDAAAVTAKYPIPTMQASECVVCHKTIDPVAGCFQDFYEFEGVYGKRKAGWYKDMFGAGFEGETLPADDRWRALQWLGERTAKDPRFAVAMVEHVYYILTGRKALLEPKDLEDPLYNARHRAYQEQRKQIDAMANRFANNGYNLKGVFKEWIASEFYRADGITAGLDKNRQAELEDVGILRMLSPEQLERKVKAVFGQPWGRLNDKQLSILYGGIDSKEVTARAADPSGAMGAIQRSLSNDVACRHTLRDFMLPAEERRLFPGIEPSVLPGSSPDADTQIRKAIVHLHDRILGRRDAADSAEVSRTFDLFAGIVADAKSQKGLDNREAYHCRANIPNAPNDPQYTIRAWRGVVTYLLRRPEFLYE
ncbi:MAG: DUF1592 domain-containing protein [Gemmataceae bacterium]